jgi:hypothetical protein
MTNENIYMNWDAVGAIGEIAGAVAVFGSLVYLAIQIKGQNIESQASVTNSLSEQWLEFMKGVSGDASLADIWTRGLASFSDLEDVERTRFAAMLGQYMQIGESFHKHHAMRKLDPGIWLGFDARMNDIVSNPGTHQYWSLRCHWYSPIFREYVDLKVNQGVTSRMYEGFKEHA